MTQQSTGESGRGKESVWDYPRPPRLERSHRRVRVELGGEIIADSDHAYRVLETSHPPTYYIPPEDVRTQYLVRSERTTFCEFKGRAVYYDVEVDGRVAKDGVWSYPDPAPDFEALADYMAFYPSKMDRCTVDGEEVKSQRGGFYGGWITSNVVGPFKGE